MIKDKIKYLLEKFYTGYHIVPGASWGVQIGEGQYVEVYINPEPSEIRDIIKDSAFKMVRMAVDKEANIYAWKSEILHDDIRKAMNIAFKYKLDYKPDVQFIINTDPMPSKKWIDDFPYRAIKQLKKSCPEAKYLQLIFSHKGITKLNLQTMKVETI